MKDLPTANRGTIEAKKFLKSERMNPIYAEGRLPVAH